VPYPITGGRLLDLDHFISEIGQMLARRVRRQNGYLDDSQAL
jgi:hypothetical protein